MIGYKNLNMNMKKTITQLWNNSKEIFTTVTGLALISLSVALYIKNFIGIDVLLIFLPCPIGLIFSKDSFFTKTKKKKKWFNIF